MKKTILLLLAIGLIFNPSAYAIQGLPNELNKIPQNVVIGECGTVSVYFPSMRIGEYRPLRITNINGSGVTIYKREHILPVGKHSLRIRPSKRVADGSVALFDVHYPFEIEVKANEIYYLAVVIAEKGSGAKYEPSIRKVSSKLCKTLPDSELKKIEHTPSTQQLLMNLQKEIEETTLAIAKHESSTNKDIIDLNYSISLPEKQYANLGLLVNLTMKDLGYQVISVTPGSDADKLGIRVNDFIQKIDGVNVGELSKKTVIGTLYKVNPDDVISLGVESKGVYQELVVKVHGVLLPAITLNVGKN